ncbi:MAG TPA: hypothetical protein VFQ61_33400 [Polyangiaceae bacterium]|nr:hypothetical protein [Polyangiaceae bacterium]
MTLSGRRSEFIAPAWFTALVLCAGLGFAPIARAAEPDARTRAAARELAVQGLESYEANDFRTALERFDRAAALFAAPTITIMQARTLEKLGHWVEALDRYAVTIAMSPPADAPDAFRRAIADAKIESQALRERTPTLELRVQRGDRNSGLPPETAGAEAGLEVRLDGQLVPPALWNVEQLVDPGPHTVTLSGPTTRSFQRLVRLEPAERARLDLPTSGPKSRKASESGAETAAVATPSADGSLRSNTASRDDHSRDPRKTWAFVAFGTGAVGASVFAITGGLALSQRGKLQDVCRPGCPESASDDLSSFRLNRNLATASAALAVLGAGIGTYLLVAGKPSQEHIALRLTPGWQSGAHSGAATLSAAF